MPDARPPVAGAWRAVLARDLKLSWRQRSDLVNPLLFYLITITLLPLGVDPSRQLLGSIAPGMLWIMALLATLLSLDSLFRCDYEDGTLVQFQLSSEPLFLTVLGKITAYWLTTGLPLALVSPLLAVMLALPPSGYLALVLSLLLGTAIMALIGALGAALTVCLRAGGLILTLVVMPLYLPVLIIGANAVSSAVAGFGYGRELALLGAGLALALMVMPAAVAGALRVSANQ
ncbi:heme exporter protein CcmB [Gilvimarinus xylanilyticus]|uniref:Heme exporter protein B n=1 Tax=Gilvimarinus xylanilyticus TaxID=2944139 RepID=A0A9X2HUE2_9GAMM|nr:heme exporter protein CcmB [Gilvimarinus xylanilyticus]MCP8898420.1 heme exporter protein CcmB [Gilvimarinus xylanilyticus]